jgi:arylsulfatase A-like enzyme
MRARNPRPFSARPFVGLFEPQVPRTVKPQFAGSSEVGLRGDVIQQADWQVGRILAALDQQGLADDTIVIFTNDNGPILFDGYDDGALEDLKTHTPAGPWSGWKYLVREGGCRSPFIVRWPGRVKPGIRPEIICLTDILATMARAAGREIPENVAVDSIDQLPVLLGTAAKPARTAVILQGISGAVALRDGHWKFIKSNADKTVNDMGSGAKPTDPRFALAITQSDLLFDLSEDPGENHDLSKQFPERLDAMRARLKLLQPAGK